MYIYFLPTNDGVIASKQPISDPRYRLIGEAHNTEELAALLSDEKFIQDYAGEIEEAFKNE